MSDIIDTASEKTGVSKDNIIKIAAVAGVVVIILIIGMLAFSSNGAYAKPFDAYAKAINSGKAEKYTKTFSKDMIDYLEDKKGIDDLEDYYDDRIDDRIDALEDEYGDDIKMKYKVISKIKYTKDELDDLKDSLEEDKDFDFKVTKAYKLAIKLTIKGDDEKASDFITADVAKIDGKWVRLSEFY